MRRHVIYTLDDDDGPELQLRHVEEVRSILRAHSGPEEAEDAAPRGPRGPHHRGYKAMSRIRGGFMAEDVAAFASYVEVLLGRRAALIDEVRAERDEHSPDGRWRRNYDGLLSVLEADQARARSLADRFVAGFAAARGLANPSPFHP